MIARRTTRRPAPWNTIKSDFKHPWLLPLRRVEWLLEWTAYALSRWSFLEVLEYLGSLSVLIGVIFYFSESGDRIMQRHYQAWQVINTAQGKGGSGGRIEALQELNADKIPLVGVDVSAAFLQGSNLAQAVLSNANMSDADLVGTNLNGAKLDGVDLSSADLRNADVRSIAWQQIAAIKSANIAGIRNAPAGFREWALKNGAVEIASSAE